MLWAGRVSAGLGARVGLCPRRSRQVFQPILDGGVRRSREGVLFTMKRHAASPEATGLQRYLRPTLISLACGAVACALLLLLFSAIVALTDLPRTLIDLFATISLAGAGFVSGYVCARQLREKGMLFGILCGSLIYLLVLLSGVSFLSEGFGLAAAFKCVAVVLAAAVGGVLGVNKKVRMGKI